MKEKFLIAAFILFHAFPYGILAQNTEIKFNQVEGDNGKSLGQINAITQDPNGYMWFSGQGKNSLYRYDGTRITAFTHDNLNPNSLSGAASMETVFADNKGLIWVGFGAGGLDQYNPETGIFKHFVNDSTDPGSLSAGMVSVILRDHLDRLWVGTQNGLDLLDEKTGKFIHYRNEPGNPSSLSYNWVRSIYEDRKGVLWIGTGFEFDNRDPNLGGLNRMESNGTFTQYKHDPGNPNSLINNKVRAIYEDSRGNFWIGTVGDGLHIMDREKGTFKRYTNNPDHPEQLSRPALKETEIPDPITFIREDAGGAIWIGTYISGISRYDTGTKKITHFEASNGYPDRSCFQSYSSRDGVLWLTSTDQSSFLYRVVPANKKLKNVISGETTGIIYEDKQGVLWTVGTLNGLVQYDQNKNPVRQSSQVRDSINIFGVTSIFQNQQDSFWLCTGNGIILFSKIDFHCAWFKFKTGPDSIPKKMDGLYISKMIEDNDHSKWIVTSAGLYHIGGDNVLIKQYLPVAGDSNTISSELLTSVIEDSAGDIWVGAPKGAYNGHIGDGGINRLNKSEGRFGHYMPGAAINNLFNDSKGNVWAETEKGLYRYEKKTDRFVNFFGSQSELSEENFINMIDDDSGTLWIVTESSIVKLNRDRTRFFIYGKNYGIRPTTLQLGGLCKTSKGEILVGYNEGYYSFYAQDMTEISKALQLNITGFFIDNLPVLPGKGSPLLNPIEKTGSVTLAFNQNNFSFSFAAIDYRAPEANKYYTRLENYDSIWREAGGDKSAAYINVPPGKYIFQVRANNIDGVNAEKSIQVIINPPWWETTWAYIFYGLLLMGVLLVIDRIQKQRTIHRERQKAQVKELAQAKEIEKAYTELKLTQTQLIQSEKMASLGELTAGIAHEIQNPLNFVNNFSDINKELLVEMKEEMDKGNIREAKGIADNVIGNEDKIIFHGKKADSIVKGMLQHSRTSSNQKEPYDINALADEYLRLSYHGFRAKDKTFNVSMHTDFDESIGKINIIPQDIGRLLLNLYNNAFYALSEKQKQNSRIYEPALSVSTRKLNSKVEIRVSDNGSGIPQKVLEKIFQPFFTTKPTGQGTGLGLSLSYDVVKAHGGEIKVETKEGEGTAFVILLPG